MLIVALTLAVLSVASTASASLPCDVCDFVVQTADSYIRTHPDAVEGQIRSALEDVCAELPQSVAPECAALVEESLVSIMQALEHIDAQAVCRELTLCSSNDPSVRHASSAASRSKIITVVSKKLSQDEVEALTPKKTQVVSVEADVDVQRKRQVPCEACEFVVQWAEDFLKHNMNATEKELVAELEMACAWTGQYESMCNSFVEKEVPIIMKYVGDMDPQQVCAQLKVCDGAFVVALMKALQQNKVHRSKAGCSVCAMVAGFVQSYVSAHDEVVEKDLEDALNHMCRVLPDYRLECQLFVANYVPQLLEFVEKEMTPSQMCDELHLCPTKKNVKNTKNTKIHAIGHVDELKPLALPCQVCEFVVGYLESYIRTHPDATIDQIEKALEANVCAHLGSLKIECDAIVDTEVPALVDALKDMPPDMVCQRVHACQ